MKSFRDFDDVLLDSSELIKKASKTIICNMGKIIAIFVFFVMLAVTFTDVSFLGFFTENFASSLLLLITSSYIIYFSLEDAGENYGEDTNEFKKANARYTALRERINGSDIDGLRTFCSEYSKKDLEYRRKSLLLSRGMSSDDILKYENVIEQRLCSDISKEELIAANEYHLSQCIAPNCAYIQIDETYNL